MRALLAWMVLLLVGAVACADASVGEDAADTGLSAACPDGYEVNGEGECAIPSLAPGEVDTPDAPFEAPTIDNSDLDAQRAYFLNQEGDGKFTLFTNETKQIGVRAIHADGRPAPGRAVEFEKVEVNAANPSGAVLSARRASTNEFGVAYINVTAGPQPSFFKLQMSADNTTGLTYQVNVVLRPETPVDPEPGVDPGPVDPADPGLAGQGNCMPTQGTYRITNLYEPARLIGDGPFQALDIIHRALASPGELVGDYIRDRIGGIWGSVIRAAVQPVIDYLYHYVVDRYAPEWVQWMLVISEDISGVLTELEIQGTMVLGPAAGPDCALRGTHRWETLVFHWRAGCDGGDPNCGNFPIPMNQLGIAASESDFDARLTRNLGPVADMEIGQHELSVNLAVAVIWFIENVILPQRLNVRNFGELLQLVLPCDAVGALAADWVGGSIIGFAVEPFVESACEAGMEALGNWLAGQLTSALQVGAFQMAGQCRLRDTDADRAADRIEDGRWTQGLEGDFEGERIR